MRILFVLPQLGISGGLYIAAKAAEALARLRHLVTVAVSDQDSAPDSSWLRPAEDVEVATYTDASTFTYDVVLATWWETLFQAPRFRAPTYSLLMQAWEASFYEWGHHWQANYHDLMGSNAFPCIVTARWMLNYASQPAWYWLCGLDHSLFRPLPPRVERSPGRVRFLVEGRLGDPRKNVSEAIDFLEQRGMEYVWVGPDATQARVGPNCAAVFSRVPIDQMAAVYSSTDALIKLSNSEGMFAPPLEMFACGGTAVSWDVWGAEEYLVHGYNSLLCPMNNFRVLHVHVGRLVEDPGLLGRLKAQARATAELWPTWDDAGRNLAICIERIAGVQNRRRFLKLIEKVSTRMGRVASSTVG